MPVKSSASADGDLGAAAGRRRAHAHARLGAALPRRCLMGADLEPTAGVYGAPSVHGDWPCHLHRRSGDGVQDHPGAKKAVHLVALAFAAVGLYAAFKLHRDFGLPDIYSLHSWLGIVTIALYALQWLVAFVYFVFPGAVMTMRADYAPWHIFFGIVIFLMAICTAETGLVRSIFPSNDYPSETFVVNFTGLSILMFGVVVVLAVILPSRY